MRKALLLVWACALGLEMSAFAAGIEGTWRGTGTSCGSGETPSREVREMKGMMLSFRNGEAEGRAMLAGRCEVTKTANYSVRGSRIYYTNREAATGSDCGSVSNRRKSERDDSQQFMLEGDTLALISPVDPAEDVPSCPIGDTLTETFRRVR